jgi:hypothetical protein
MIRSLSLRNRWATASTRASADPVARVAFRRAAVVVLARPPERPLVERELDDRDALERELAERLAVDRGLLLARELVDERPVLLDLEALVLRRLELFLELEPDPPLLACGIFPP